MSYHRNIYNTLTEYCKALDITLDEGKILNIIAKLEQILNITVKSMCDVEGFIAL